MNVTSQNAVVDFPDAKVLPDEGSRDNNLLAVHADSAAAVPMGIRRVSERRIRSWRAMRGEAQEVIFRQARD